MEIKAKREISSQRFIGHKALSNGVIPCRFSLMS